MKKMSNNQNSFRKSARLKHIKLKTQKNIIVIMFFSVFIAIFALLNSEVVPVNLIFIKLNLSTALVILISATIGAIIIYSFNAIILYKLRQQLKDYEKKVEVEATGVAQPEDFLKTEQSPEE